MKPVVVLMTFMAWAAHAGAVPLCLSRLTLVNNAAIIRAQAIVTRVFADAGVRVDWLSDRECSKSAARAIYIMMEARVPPRFGEATLGYAEPYNGATAVHIFYDRIRDNYRSEFPLIMGYTMAHEIAHALEGLVRHSERGIMKGHWTPDDYDVMHRRRLKFDNEDVELIQLGLRHAAQASLAARK